jgi:hypothetical protein
LAGYDLNLLPRYAGVEIEHEHKKLVRIGASVLIPSFFGFGTAFFFFGPFVEETKLKIIFAFMVSMILLAIDCIVVTTLSKNRPFGLFIRIAMSICLGIVISEPALLMLYQKTINAEIQKQLTFERKIEEDEIKKKLSDIQEKLTETESKLQKSRNSLADYSNENIAQLRFLESKRRIDERIGYIAQDKQKMIQTQTDLIKEFEDKLKAKQSEIEAKMLEMKAEEEGNRGSAKKGRGPFWDKLNAEKSGLERQAKSFQEDIDAAKAEVNHVRSDHSEENSIKQKLQDPRLPGLPKTGLLTEQEQADKDHLQKDVDVYTINQNAYRKQIGDFNTDLQGLSTKYDLSTRNDTLTQTAALYKIILENNILLIKVLSLFFLVFFIDTAPVFVKLTARTGYDDYFKALNRDHTAKSVSEIKSYYEAVMESRKERNFKLLDYMESMDQRIKKADGEKSRYAKSIRSKIGEALEKNTEDMLWEIEQAEEKQSSPSFWSALKHIWSLFKLKIGNLWTKD